MFGSHRRDLKDAHAAHVRALEKLVTFMADEIDYLRAKVAGYPHIPASVPSLNPSGQPPATGGNMYLSEEEEDALALHLNDYLGPGDLAALRDDLGLDITGIELPPLEPDE